MKKAISVIPLALLLISGFTVPAVFSAEQTGQTKNREATGIDWQQALKAQVALAALVQFDIERNPLILIEIY